MLKKETRLDAAGEVFFEEQLEQIKAKTYDVRHSDLKATSLIPVGSDYDPGTEIITFRTYDSVGMAKFVSDYANDFPRADVFGTEKSVKPKDIGMSYAYSIREIQRAQQAGFALDAKRAAACKRAIEQMQNRVGFKGDAVANINGLFNITGANIASCGVSETFANMTAAQLVAAFTALIQASGLATNGVETPDTVLMPLALYNKLTSTEFSSSYPKSVMTYLKETFSEITKWDWVPELTGGSSITAGRSMCVAYKRSIDKLELIIPELYTQYAPQQKGLAFEVLATQRTAGVVAYYPMSVTYMEEGA